LAAFLTFIQGMLMGIANIIPGVSGGTFALILGIYERLIASIVVTDLPSTDFIGVLHARLGRPSTSRGRGTASWPPPRSHCPRTIPSARSSAEPRHLDDRCSRMTRSAPFIVATSTPGRALANEPTHDSAAAEERAAHSLPCLTKNPAGRDACSFWSKWIGEDLSSHDYHGVSAI